MALNIILAPLIYFTHSLTLFTNIFNDRKEASKNIIIFMSFFVFGLPALILTSLIDVPIFFFNLYTRPVEDRFNSRKTLLENFEKKSFIKFTETIDLVMEEVRTAVRTARKEGGDLSKLLCDKGHLIIQFADFNIRLQEEF